MSRANSLSQLEPLCVCVCVRVYVYVCGYVGVLIVSYTQSL